RDGELDMMSIWNGRATELKQIGLPVELVWNGAVRSTSTWCVLKGAPNRKLAWEFIQFATQPKPQAEFNRRLYYAPTNPAAGHSGSLRVHSARYRGGASNLQREPRRFDPGGRRMGGGPDRRNRGALHPVARLVAHDRLCSKHLPRSRCAPVPLRGGVGGEGSA